MAKISFMSLLTLPFIMLGCQSLQPIYTVKHVDLDRFMGDWYVIACIPTFIEKDAFNAVESYQLNPDGTVATTFTFNKGGFDGKKKSYHPRGFVVEGTGNAVWNMQFIWPFKAEYRIIYLTEDYQQTVIGRSKRDYFWLMARTAAIAEDDYKAILKFLVDQGYSLDHLRKVPHQ
jgi:apolipoprotein D and lipocalin family protein